MCEKNEIEVFVILAGLLVIDDLNLILLLRANKGIIETANSMIFCLPFFFNVKEIFSRWFHKIIAKHSLSQRFHSTLRCSLACSVWWKKHAVTHKL